MLSYYVRLCYNKSVITCVCAIPQGTFKPMMAMAVIVSAHSCRQKPSKVLQADKNDATLPRAPFLAHGLLV